MPNKRPPGPKGHFLLGSMLEFNRDTLSYLDDLTQYGDMVFLRFGPFPVYFVNHPDLVHEVLVSEASKFYKSRSTKQALSDISGVNVFTADGDVWKRERKLMQPAFHAKRIGAYADTMVDYTRQLIADWVADETLPIDQQMTKLTMNIVLKTLFDAEAGDESAELGAAMTTLFKVVDQRLQTLLDAPHWMPTARNRELWKARERIDQIVLRIIDERRKSGEDRGDLLSMLLLAQDGSDQMSDQQVRNEALTIFGAGHETTTVAMTWTWYLLSQHPEVEARLHEEVDRVLGDQPPTLADLQHMPYSEMVVKEAMRLYPPAWATTREAIKDVTIGGYTIKKGTTVILAPWTLHRDPRWFADPHRFDPERFKPENESNIPKYAYIPFGGGPRVCIGNAFAMMEARLILATIAQRYQLALDPGQVVEPERVFTLRSKYGMKMQVKTREKLPVIS